MGGFQYVYSLVESECETEGQCYKGYGIRVQDTRTMETHTYPDISTEREKIEELLALCNELCLDAIHIEDVIEDILV